MEKIESDLSASRVTVVPLRVSMKICIKLSQGPTKDGDGEKDKNLTKKIYGMEK